MNVSILSEQDDEICKINKYWSTLNLKCLLMHLRSSRPRKELSVRMLSSIPYLTVLCI